jgi:predicted transcriptional regulator
MKERKNLPEAELDIMLVIWYEEKKEGEGVTAPRILEKLERPLTASALHSYLKRLEERGYLRCEKAGRVNRYVPLISEEEYQRQESGGILERLYGGSLKAFTAALWDGGELSLGDLDEMRDFLDELSWRRR